MTEKKVDSGGQASPRDNEVAHLLPLAYDHLKTLARQRLKREGARNRLQTTELVHEACVRLMQQQGARVQDQTHLLAIAAVAMRRAVVDHVRHHRRSKRGGRWKRVSMTAVLDKLGTHDLDVLDLDEALSRLAANDARKARLVELRFFGGLTIEQSADYLEISLATAKREWTIARGWLYRELVGGDDEAR